MRHTKADLRKGPSHETQVALHRARVALQPLLELVGRAGSEETLLKADVASPTQIRACMLANICKEARHWWRESAPSG